MTHEILSLAVNVASSNVNMESGRTGAQEGGGGRRKHTKQRLGSTPGSNSVLKQSKYVSNHFLNKICNKVYNCAHTLTSFFSEETGMAVAKRSISLDRENNKTRTSNRDSSLDNADRRNSRQVVTNKIPPFLLLSQVCKFALQMNTKMGRNLMRIFSRIRSTAIELALRSVGSIIAVLPWPVRMPMAW